MLKDPEFPVHSRYPICIYPRSTFEKSEFIFLCITATRLAVSNSIKPRHLVGTLKSKANPTYLVVTAFPAPSSQRLCFRRMTAFLVVCSDGSVWEQKLWSTIFYPMSLYHHFTLKYPKRNLGGGQYTKAVATITSFFFFIILFLNFNESYIQAGGGSGREGSHIFQGTPEYSSRFTGLRRRGG